MITVNQKKKKNIFFFDDVIADIMGNKKFQAIIKELFIRCRKLNISLAFITQSYFLVQKDVRLNSAHYFIMKKTLQSIILQTLTITILRKFTENVQKNHIIFRQ